MSTTPSIPLRVAREVVAHHELFEVILAALEERCTSYALDDANDRRNTAYVIADALAARGVTP